MHLIVEGTSRWCWCHPFYYKTADHIAGIISKFIKLIDERITCLVTDGGNEWAGIPELTEEYGFVWKRKNVALTGHGAMARLDRTVRTLRYYMEMLWLASEPRENNWYKLFQMAVWVHNNSAHQFCYLPPQYLICAPDVMAKVRKNDYRKKVRNYLFQVCVFLHSGFPFWFFFFSLRFSSFLQVFLLLTPVCQSSSDFVFL